MPFFRLPRSRQPDPSAIRCSNRRECLRRDERREQAAGEADAPDVGLLEVTGELLQGLRGADGPPEALAA
ncbi:hypothetical protein CAL65_22810 [Alkalilimnicola ehrlichii]|uniref:Uncharacterized protein n=1 Tax=Alkalilimnicola ehrlichii TaxID=351052 RepID=A0A3E0WHL0_9GAMM|nr:hypothetical protein CAL65_22810 [Alkalilimnicola ehrlichii]